MPMLTPTLTGCPSRSKDWLMASIRLPASAVAAMGCSSLICTIANSSALSRAIRSRDPRQPRSRSPTAFSMASPDVCPSVSLISLKRSRSRHSTATFSPLRALAVVSSRRSRRCRRLGRSVSTSCRAKWATCASMRRYWVMSSCVEIQPPSGMRRCLMAMTRPSFSSLTLVMALSSTMDSSTSRVYSSIVLPTWRPLAIRCSMIAWKVVPGLVSLSARPYILA